MRTSVAIMGAGPIGTIWLMREKMLAREASLTRHLDMVEGRLVGGTSKGVGAVEPSVAEVGAEVPSGEEEV